MYSDIGKTMDVSAPVIFPNCACRDELIRVCYKEENEKLRKYINEKEISIWEAYAKEEEEKQIEKWKLIMSL